MTPTKTQCNSTCNRCKLHEYAHPKSVGLRGIRSGVRESLVLFVDHPDYFADAAHAGFKLDTKKFLDNALLRMSLDPERVAYEYTLRCYPQKSLPTTKAERAHCIEECSSYRFSAVRRLAPRAICVLGKTSIEAFTGRTFQGVELPNTVRVWEPVVRDYVPHVWCGYSVNYALVTPSAAPDIFRVIYHAAIEAGFKPKLDPAIPPFVWRNLK